MKAKFESMETVGYVISHSVTVLCQVIDVKDVMGLPYYQICFANGTMRFAMQSQLVKTDSIQERMTA